MKRLMWSETPVRRAGGRAAIALAAGLLMANTAQADSKWAVNGQFSDGTTISGIFTLNAYGYLSGWNLTTQDAAPFQGLTYSPANTLRSNSATVLDFSPAPTGDGDLHLVFAESLTSPSHNDPLVTGGVSGESQNTFSYGAAGTTRYLVSGAASTVAEPTAWAMLIAGVGLAGAGLRRRRARTAAAA